MVGSCCQSQVMVAPFMMPWFLFQPIRMCVSCVVDTLAVLVCHCRWHHLVGRIARYGHHMLLSSLEWWPHTTAYVLDYYEQLYLYHHNYFWFATWEPDSQHKILSGRNLISFYQAHTIETARLDQSLPLQLIPWWPWWPSSGLIYGLSVCPVPRPDLVANQRSCGARLRLRSQNYFIWSLNIYTAKVYVLHIHGSHLCLYIVHNSIYASLHRILYKTNMLILINS